MGRRTKVAGGVFFQPDANATQARALKFLQMKHGKEQREMAFLVSRCRRFAQLLFCVLAISLNSCVYLVIGGVGVVGGYAISPDTFEGVISDHSPSEAWNAAIDVVSVMGLILERNDAAGIMIAKVQGAKVTITIVRVNENSVKVTVKARKAFFPKITVAQDIYMKILKSLTG